MNYLVSFADKRLQRSLDRLSIQAREINFFDKLFIMNETNLSSDFKYTFKNKLIKGSKGYGYWCWKPEIILNILDKINYGDCLLYIDAGCHLNSSGKNRLKEYFDLLMKEDKGIIVFQANKPNKNNSIIKYDGRKLRNLRNYKWIKGDIFDYFKMRNNIEIINSQEINGGVILIKKCNYSISVISEWKKIILENFNFIDDTPSLTKNLPGFIENRHDQAIWSLLCLKNKIKSLSSYELWYPKKNSKKVEADWYQLKDTPIHVKRDKDFGLKNNIINYFKKKLYKLKNIISKSGLIKKPVKNYLN